MGCSFLPYSSLFKDSSTTMTPDLSNSLIDQFDAITFHFDGNNNDKDDIAALPIAATLAKAVGLEDKITFFYGNNVSESNNTYQVGAMRDSAAFAEKLGIDAYSYQDGIQQTTDELVKILDSGQKVLAIEGGPMEAIYRALEQTSPENRSNVTLLSHSSWNENRAVGTRPGGGKPRTWSDIDADFPEVTQIDIRDQNNGSNNDRGFNSFKWEWLDTTENPVLQEARSLMQNAQGKVNDPSDAGMLFYAITGQETANPDDAQAFFDTYPPSFSEGSSPPPPLEPTPDPAPNPEPEVDGGVIRFALVDAETNEVVEGYDDLSAIAQIDLNTLAIDAYSIVAQVNPSHPDADKVESVKFESNLGNRTENIVPYALFGDSNGDFRGKALTLGDVEIKATAYTRDRGKGEAIATANVAYSVIDSTSIDSTSPGVTLAIAKDGATGQIEGTDNDDIISIRTRAGNSTTTLVGGGDDTVILYGADQIPEGNYHEMLESLKQNPVEVAAEYFGATHSVDLGSGQDDGADTLSLVSEIDARPKFLLKHTQSDGRINGKGVAGENNKAYDHWAGVFGLIDVANFDPDSDTLNLVGHTTVLGESFTHDGDFFQTVYSEQNANNQSGPRAGAAHDDTFLGLLKFGDGAALADAIADAITVKGMENYVVDGLGKDVYEGDPTTNQSGDRISSEALLTFSLINSETNDIVNGYETLENGAEINLNGLDLEKYSIVANVNPDHFYAELVESVKFESNLGNQIESVVPYAMFGDTEGNFSGKPPAPGNVTLKATAYNKDGGNGKAIESVELTYSIVNTGTSGSNTGSSSAMEAGNNFSNDASIDSGGDAEAASGSINDPPTESTSANDMNTSNAMSAHEFVQKVLDLTNQFRVENGRSPLTLNQDLTEAAQDHVEDMAQDDFFSHTGKDGSSVLDRVQDAGYAPRAVGENIAAGQTTPEQVVQGWINSPGHRSNMLSPNFTEIGIGYEFLANDTGNINYNHYWAQVFGKSLSGTVSPPPTSPSPAPTESPIEAPAEPPAEPDLMPDMDRAGLDLSRLTAYGGRRQSPSLKTTLGDDNTSVRLEGNGWRKLRVNYTITPETMMSFEFRSDAEGEIHSIGFDTNNAIGGGDRRTSFQLFGVQDWGIGDFETSMAKAGWQSFEIPVGEYLRGAMKYLTLGNDQDIANPDAVSEFRNIMLYEASDDLGSASSPPEDVLTGSMKTALDMLTVATDAASLSM